MPRSSMKKLTASKMTLKDQIKKLIEKYRAHLKKKDERIKTLERELIEKGNGVVLKLPVQIPDEIKVANFPEKTEVSNFPAIQKVQVINHPEQKEIQAVKITNVKEIEKAIAENKPPAVQDVNILSQPDNSSKWLPGVIIASVESLSALWVKLWKTPITIKLDDTERYKPIPVIMVDVLGRPVPVQQPAQFVALPNGGGRTSGTPPATTINSGRQTVTTPGTAVALKSIATICSKLIVTAPGSNTNAVYIGGKTVSAQSGSEQGLLLNPTGSAILDIDDLSKVYIDAVTGGEGVTFTWTR